MSCRSAAIADAWTTWLNTTARGFTFPSGISALGAVRTWAPLRTLPELDTQLYPEVVPVTLDPIQLLSRGAGVSEYLTLLFLRQRYTPPPGATTAAVPNAWVDERAALVEQIALATRDLKLTGMPSGYLTQVKPDRGIVVDPLVDYLQLQEFAIFEACIQVTWLEVAAR